MFQKQMKHLIKETIIDQRNERGVLLPGFHYVFNKTHSTFMRCVWFLMIITCFSLCCFQSIQRMLYYYEIPVVVDAYIQEINYGDMPALILCAANTKSYSQFLKQHYTGDNMHIIYNYCSIGLALSEPGVTTPNLWKYLNTSNILTETVITQKNSVDHANIEEYLYPCGTCAKIYSENPVKLGDPSVKMKIKLQHIYGTDYTRDDPLMWGLIQSKDRKQWDQLQQFLLSARSYTKLTTVLEQYKYVNNSKTPCADFKTFEKCEENCYDTFIKKNIPTLINSTAGRKNICRLPFMSKKLQWPPCNTSNETKELYDKVINVYQTIIPTHHCNCKRLCEFDLIRVHDYTDDTEFPSTITLRVNSNLVRTLVERYAYDIISLMCDVGGNIGLYLGLSLLCLIDLTCGLVYKLKRIIQLCNGRNDQMLRLRKKITILLANEGLKRESAKSYLRRITDDKSHICLRLLRLTMTIIISMVFIWQVYYRICYFLSYPIVLSVEVTVDAMVEFPKIVWCFDNTEISDLYQSLANRRSNNETHCLKNDFLDFLNASEQPVTVEELWEKSLNIELIIEAAETEKYMKDIQGQICRGGNKANFSTVYGMCTEISVEPVTYTTGFISLAWLYEENCATELKLSFTPPGKGFSVKRFMYQKYGTAIVLRLSRQMIRRFSRPTDPCTTIDVANTCEKLCLERLLIEKLKCRLPFMVQDGNIPLPSCNSSITDAKEAREEYLKIVTGMDSVKMCGCHKSCQENIYNLRQTYNNLGGRYSGFMMFAETNIWEIINEKEAFPIEKLVCDVGSILGFFLGMSILTFVQFCQEMTQKLNYKLTNKK